jgi:hypothetical protein
MGKAMLTIMAAFAQLERDTMIERTRAGLAAFAANGRKGGRPRKVDDAAAAANLLRRILRWTLDSALSRRFFASRPSQQRESRRLRRRQMELAASESARKSTVADPIPDHKFAPPRMHGCAWPCAVTWVSDCAGTAPAERGTQHARTIALLDNPVMSTPARRRPIQWPAF